MKLEELGKWGSPRKKRKLVGRGIGSGHGKTSCKGHKGQKARSGGSICPGFEGGQMPLIRRIPKRGFTSVDKKEYVIINLKDLNKFEKGAKVTPELLMEKGFYRKKGARIKILGMGELKNPLDLKAHGFSKDAQEKIKNAGGTFEIIK
ncbi:MAG: 50S ribosomal protein L15 [bacterium]